MYKAVMVPLDGSRFAESALPLAVGLAQRAGADLHLLMVAEPSGPTARACEEYLLGTAEWLAPDFCGEVTTVVRAGNIVDKVLDELRACEADATVMATHGRGGLSRVWLGSITTGFLHETDKPLILVRPEGGDGSETAVHSGFAKLLIPLDGTELSERVLAYATEFGGLFDAAYHLTRVVSPPIQFDTPYGPTSVDVTTELLKTAKRSAFDYLEACAEPMRAKGLTVSLSVSVDAQPGRGILEAIEAEGCDSIAMATHGRLGLVRAFLGSVADKVLRGTDVPLLLYRLDSMTG